MRQPHTTLSFQFRKVQLILYPRHQIDSSPLFQFRKVQLILPPPRGSSAASSVSIPQGPINTRWSHSPVHLLRVSIPQGPINTSPLLGLGSGITVSIPQGPINTQHRGIMAHPRKLFQFRKVQLILSHQSNNHHYK